MLYFFENEHFKVAVSDIGAELFSVVSKRYGCEYIWQGDPKYWENRAPMLFPVCCRLYSGHYTYQGKKYFMDIHGFARTSVFSPIEVGEDFIKMALTSTESTKNIYPFDFVLTVEFRLVGNRLKYIMTVENKETERAMIYALGGHPGFNVPLDSDNFKEWYIEFDRESDVRRFAFTDTCFRTEKEPLFPLENGKILRLDHSLFDNDAIFLRDHCRCLTLKSDNSDRSVRIEAEEMNYLGLWHAPKTDAPYVCIEPMSGLPSFDGKVDDLEKKADMIRLAPGNVRSTGFDMIFG